MRRVSIKFSQPDQVAKFVRILNRYDVEASIKCGSRTVNAKSIMGIFSLDLSKPVTLCAHFDDADGLFAELKKFRAA